ncbi:MAG: FtsW/RodA/SpoVE family cell cycle protein [Planctomycetota bacterium]|nr:FtsW/RodA/SpoVE family cell cycle protein [Planctomycetota bacterium]
MPRSRELVVIFSLLLLTFGVGFAKLTASTNADLDPELPLLTRHPEFLHAGIAACCLLLGWSTTLSGKMIDRLLNKQVVGLALAIGLGLLGLSLFVAIERWVTLGGLRFQASEPLKFAIPLLCGVSLARTSGKVKIREHPWLLLITAGVAAAIAIQDLGSAALVLGTLVMLLFAAGADWRWLPAGIITLGLFGGLYIGMEEYRIRRLGVWLAPWEQTNTNEGAQLTESLRAIHQGGLEGTGVGQGLRSQGYLPVDESDFVFAILAEETGVLGSALVLTTFAGLIFSLWRVAWQCPNPAARWFGVAVTITVAMQTAINVWVATGLLPTKGIALPFISRAGTGWILLAGAIMATLMASHPNHEPEPTLAADH